MKDKLGGVSDKLSQTGRNVVNKTKKMTEMSKVKAELEAEKELRDDQYLALGKAYYECSKQVDQAEYEAIFTQIRVYDQKIKHLEEQLTLMKGVRACPRCGYEMKASAVYCGQCGLNIVSFLNNQ